MRGASYIDNLKTIEVAEKYLNKGVVALDLAGDEKHFKTKDYEELFKIAKEKNIPFTIHAGEADDASSVLDAISFGTKRIGHGIRIIDDDNAIGEVIKNKVTLEVCPTSNFQTKVIDSYKNHPIKRLYEKGVLITVSTDNNTVSNTTLSLEYERLKSCFGFTDKDLLTFNINAINAAFISDLEKEKYIKILKGD